MNIYSCHCASSFNCFDSSETISVAAGSYKCCRFRVFRLATIFSRYNGFVEWGKLFRQQPFAYCAYWRLHNPPNWKKYLVIVTLYISGHTPRTSRIFVLRLPIVIHVVRLRSQAAAPTYHNVNPATDSSDSFSTRSLWVTWTPFFVLFLFHSSYRRRTTVLLINFPSAAFVEVLLWGRRREHPSNTSQAVPLCDSHNCHVAAWILLP